MAYIEYDLDLENLEVDLKTVGIVLALLLYIVGELRFLEEKQ